MPSRHSTEDAEAASELQPSVIYGLTEFYRDEIRGARLVAGTGCNAATVQYALRPLVTGDVIDLDDIICDLKNGVSGAGRALTENMLFTDRSQDRSEERRDGKECVSTCRARGSPNH